MRRALQAAWLVLGACTADAPPAPVERLRQPLADTEAQLADAVELYRRTRAEALRVATDPNERFETRVGAGWLQDRAAEAAYETLFIVGDAAFEVEFSRAGGSGRGRPPAGHPATVARIHDGELGGYDGSSCRSCHFVGGPDGAGTITQVGLFRGDGQRLSTAIVRDAPHVMGLGYLAQVARETEATFEERRRFALEEADFIGEPVRVTLRANGIDYGALTAHPGGALDTAELRGVSPDLRIRPFGLKGRHATLVDLVDEALQVHHGLQTTARMARFAEDPETWLGPGGPFDPDDDGFEIEGGPEQSVLLAAYLSMLGVPEVRAPTSPGLAREWARGWAQFQDWGCAECHRPRLGFRDYTAHLEAPNAEWAIAIPLDLAGQDPVPNGVDFGPLGPDDLRPGGVPIFAFTDLRRHDMGPELADPHGELLPDGGGTVPASVWLTRPLWGLADTAPYLHDGRAPTVDSAIRWHGGEGAAARARYVEATAAEQAALRVFLASLTRAPVVLVE